MSNVDRFIVSVARLNLLHIVMLDNTKQHLNFRSKEWKVFFFFFFFDGFTKISFLFRPLNWNLMATKMHKSFVPKANEGSTVVKQQTRDPKFEGSNPASDGTWGRQIAQKSFVLIVKFSKNGYDIKRPAMVYRPRKVLWKTIFFGINISWYVWIHLF